VAVHAASQWLKPMKDMSDKTQLVSRLLQQGRVLTGCVAESLRMAQARTSEHSWVHLCDAIHHMSVTPVATGLRQAGVDRLTESSRS
jgi:hypothetical protein